MPTTTGRPSTSRVDALLDAAARLGPSPDYRRLADLAGPLRPIATQLDAKSLRSTLTVEAPRLILGRHRDGPALVVAWFPPTEPSTVHSHAWTVLGQLDGETSLERWTAGPGDGLGRLRDVRRVATHDTVTITRGEVHRQTGCGDGSLELVLIGDYRPQAPRTAYRPEPASARAAALIAGFVDGYRRADADAALAMHRTDVVLDANVPQWRFQVRGRDAIAAVLRREEFLPDYRLTDWHGAPTADGAVVELECRFTAAGEPRLAREMHLLRGDDAEVSEHVLYCTGTWDPATIARHAAQAGVRS